MHTETLSLAQDTLVRFASLYGPGTVVNLIFGDLDIGETLAVGIVGSSDLAAGIPADYVLEQVTIPASPTIQTAYQATPVPMPNSAWYVFVEAMVSGGSGTRQFTRVAILL